VAPNSSAANKYSATGKRDPFRSIIQSHESANSECATGKKCLVANLVILKGIVKGPDGMLAVVENQHHKSYFLREKDPVFNGQVIRITPDSIVFREKVVDKTGHETTHEVVKHITGGKPGA
jgi:Tfp pilus assembly protein PilP